MADARRETAGGTVTIALDDFGTGYLSRFPVDTIKIDRSFVRDMSTSDTSMTIVRTILGLGHGLGKSIVAEGVETLVDARLLAGLGCQELQGYLLGRPMPIASFAAIDHAAIEAIVASRATAAPVDLAA